MKGSSLASALLVLCLLLSPSFAQGEMMKALQDYYKYSKDENIDAYYGVMDLSEFSPGAQQLRKEATQTVWERFDTLSYEISNASEYAKDDFGIIEYHISARVRGPDGKGGQAELPIEEDLIAVMHKVDGKWKVNQVQQIDIFYANMENFYLEAQSDVIGEINEKAIEKIEAEPPSGAANVTVGSGCRSDADCGAGKVCTEGRCHIEEPPLPCLAFLALVLVAGFASFGRRTV